MEAEALIESLQAELKRVNAENASIRYGEETRLLDTLRNRSALFDALVEFGLPSTRRDRRLTLDILRKLGNM